MLIFSGWASKGTQELVLLVAGVIAAFALLSYLGVLLVSHAGRIGRFLKDVLLSIVVAFSIGAIIFLLWFIWWVVSY